MKTTRHTLQSITRMTYPKEYPIKWGEKELTQAILNNKDGYLDNEQYIAFMENAPYPETCGCVIMNKGMPGEAVWEICDQHEQEAQIQLNQMRAVREALQ